MPEQTFTKAEAISEFSSLIRDLEADARLDDSAVDRGHEWNAMVKTWRGPWLCRRGLRRRPDLRSRRARRGDA